MAITVEELRAIITADDAQYQQRMAAVLTMSERARAGATQMSAAFDQVGPSLIKAGAALTALAAGFALLVKSGSDLQQELVHVAGNTSMSAAEFDNLEKSVVRLGLTTPVAMGDIGRSYMQASNFGFKFAEANTVVEAALKSAVATGANAEQTTRALAIAMHQFNIPASEAAKTMDILHLSAARGGQTLEQFTAVTGRVFAVARSMGISLADVSAALSALTSSGLSAAQSATLLQGAIVKIANPAKGAHDEIVRLSKATGVDLVSDFSKAGFMAKDLSGVMADIGKAVGSDTAEILKLVPALRGGIGVILLTTTAMNDYTARLKENHDVLAGKLTPTVQDAERVMKTLGAQTAILGNSFQALGFELVKSLGPSLVGAITTLNSVVPQAVLFIGQLPPVIIAATAAFFAAVGVVGTVSVALGGLVFLLGGPVTAAIVAVGVAVGGLAAIFALNFNRITAIASSGAGAVGTNFVAIAGKTGAVADAFQILARVAVSSFDIIVTGAVLMAQGVKAAFNTVGDAGKAALALAGNDMVGFASAMGSMAGTTLDAAKSISQSLKGLATRGISDLNDISSHWSGQFAKGFALAAATAGQSFAKASAEQHALMEGAGLKLVNAYITGVVKGKPISAAAWHSMSDEARSSFTQTAQSWVQAATGMAEGMDEVAKKAGAAGKKASDELEKVLKAQVDTVNDWLKSSGREIEISAAAWNLLPVATQAALIKQADAFHKSIDELQAFKAQQLAAAIVSGEAWAPALHLVLDAVDELVPAEKELTGVIESANAMMEAGRPAAADMSASLTMLKAALHNLKEDIASSPLFNALKMKDETAHAFDEVINLTKSEGERLGLTEDQINQKILANLAIFGKQFGEQYGISADQAITIFKRQMDRLPGALDEIFNKLALGAKRQVAGLFQVIDSIPGKFGDAFRKSTNEVTRWIDQIDGLLKGLHKIFASVPDGLAGALESIVGIFKSAHNTIDTSMALSQDQIQKTAKAASQGLDELSGALKQSGDEATATAGKWVSAVAGVVSGISIFMGSRHQGLAQGILGGALGGFTAGAAIGSIVPGIGTLIGGAIGGIVGAIGGIFGSGKSAAQREAERQAAENAKIGMQQAAQSVINSAIEGFDKAIAFFDHLDSFTAPRKEKFRQFFESFKQLMDNFLEMSKAWASDSLAIAKAAAEAIAPVANAISSLPNAFAAISGHFSLAQSAIDSFFVDFDRIVTAFFARVEAWGVGQAKHARKVADNIAPAVDLLSPVIDAIKNMADLKSPPDAAFDIIDSVLNTIITRTSALSEKFDKSLLRAVANFGDSAGVALILLKDATDTIRAMVDLPTPTQGDFDRLFAGIESGINGMINLAATIDTEAVAKAQTIANSSLAIFAAIKAAVESLGALRDYKSIAQEAIDAIMSDFKRGIILLNLLILDVTEAESKAKTFDQIVTSMAGYLAHGVSAYVGAFTSMASALTGMPSGGTSLTPGPGFGSVGGMSTQSLSSKSTTIVNHYQMGDITFPEGSRAAELFKLFVDEVRRHAVGGMPEPYLA